MHCYWPLLQDITSLHFQSDKLKCAVKLSARFCPTYLMEALMPLLKLHPNARKAFSPDWTHIREGPSGELSGALNVLQMLTHTQWIMAFPAQFLRETGRTWWGSTGQRDSWMETIALRDLSWTLPPTQHCWGVQEVPSSWDRVFGVVLYRCSVPSYLRSLCAWRWKSGWLGNSLAKFVFLSFLPYCHQRNYTRSPWLLAEMELRVACVKPEEQHGISNLAGWVALK